MVFIVPYALLGILAVITSAEKSGPGLLTDLGLCALAAVWMLIPLLATWWARPWVRTLFFTVLLAITAVLVVRDSWFGFFVVALYVYAFRSLPWPGRLAGVAGVAVLAGVAQGAGMDRATPFDLALYGAVLLANVLPMCAFTWFLRRFQQQHDELREAHRRLEASLAENAELAREAGVRDERQRMAREIHDTLAQGLTGIVAQLQAVERPDRHVLTATQLARESLVEARRSVEALRPEALETARLGEALASVAERWSVRHEVPVQVTTTGTVRPVRPDVEAALLRTAQEALANVAKHAAAGRVGVTLSYLDGEVALDVRDDGTGFDPGVTGDGFGLVAMRQRIEGLAGRLQIESEPGAGTGISACVPAVPMEART